jgi:hypothetical protein
MGWISRVKSMAETGDSAAAEPCAAASATPTLAKRAPAPTGPRTRGIFIL